MAIEDAGRRLNERVGVLWCMADGARGARVTAAASSASKLLYVPKLRLIALSPSVDAAQA